MIDQEYHKLLVQGMLENWRAHTWTLQGFGMLRTYLGDGKATRLHVWDSRFRAPNVSLVHTHPWDFKSHVISGGIVDTMFREKPPWHSLSGTVAYMRQTVCCGEGGGLEGEPELKHLVSMGAMAYYAGSTYERKAADIHFSHPTDGAVTLVERTFGSDVDHANVYWRAGTEWVSAEPRPATEEEIDLITGYALYRWMK